MVHQPCASKAGRHTLFTATALSQSAPCSNAGWRTLSGAKPPESRGIFLPLVGKSRYPLAGSTYPARRRAGPLLARGRLRAARLRARLGTDRVNDSQIQE